jgi:hypothetical protein
MVAMSASSTLAARCPRRDFGKSHFWGSYIQAKRSQALEEEVFCRVYCWLE